LSGCEPARTGDSASLRAWFRYAVDGTEAPRLLAYLPELVASRLSLLALNRLEEAGLEAPEDLRRAGRALAAATLRAEAALDRAAAIIQELPCLLLKGPTLAYLWPPGTRGWTDVDLLLPARYMAEAGRRLRRAGFRPLIIPDRSTARARYEQLVLASGHAMAFVGQDGSKVDLHVSVPPATLGSRIPYRSLSTAAVRQAPLPFPSLAPGHVVMTAALHALSHGSQVASPWVDFVFAARRFGTGEALDEARALGLLPAVAVAASYARFLHAHLPLPNRLTPEALRSPLAMLRALLLLSPAGGDRLRFLASRRARYLPSLVAARLRGGPLGRSVTTGDRQAPGRAPGEEG
jgi:hypothetical protein